MAKTSKSTKLNLAGSPIYMSPEVVCGSIYDKETDIWSLGVTLFFLASLVHPFECSKGETLQDLYNQILTSQIKFPVQFSSQFKDLLSKMLHKKPE